MQTSFRGTTLRGLLLEAYAFSTIGAIMLWGAIASFIGAILMSVLVGLGFWHARRVEVDERMPAPNGGSSLLLTADPTTPGPKNTTPPPVRRRGRRPLRSDLSS